MADESKLQVLERKIAVARRELNKIRSDVNSMKKMFIQKFKEVKELSVQEKLESTMQDTCNRFTSGKEPQMQDTQEHKPFHSEMKPIGFVESCFKEKNGIPRQASVCPAAKAKLFVNVEGFTNPEHALEGLEKFSHVWIIFLFHKNTNKAIKAKVKPPRLDGAKVGVFASRSPHRPNPIGLTLAKLDGVIGSTLLLSGIDLLDGTPVLDIKPYVPDYDKPPCFDICKERMDVKSDKEVLCQNMDDSKSQETVCVDKVLPSSVDAQLGDQSSMMQIPDILDSKGQSTHANIAEWIRKPPIKELDVKFCAEAVDQISCFHGNRIHCGGSDGKPDDSLVQRCTCVQTPGELLGRFVSGKIGEEEASNRSKICLREEPTDERLTKNCETAETDCDDSNEGSKLLSCVEVSADKGHMATLKGVKDNALEEELKVSVCERGPLIHENVSGSVKENLYEGSVALSHRKLLKSPEKCIYQLEMLSSSEEAKTAITDILKADPRSIYRRNQCQEQLYRFSIDTMNVTCKFEDSTVEVLRVEPVYYRKLNRASKGTHL